MIRLPIRASHIALAGSLALTGLAAPAAAQDLPNDPTATTRADATGVADSDEGAIVVTARRREENLVDVPIAVTAYSGASLNQAGAIDITDISQTTPNTTLEASRGTNSTLSAFIRGVGQQDPVSGFEQGVGIYLDDVYLNRPQAAVMDIYDVERIEVLRGPQGTLYGRNTIGGAVKYVTRILPQDPSLDLRATYGSYNQLDGVISGSVPVSDLIRVGGAFARLTRDGFGENLTTGLDNYDKDLWAARGTFELGGYDQPVLIRISGDYTRDKSNPRGGHRFLPGLVSGAPVLKNVYDTRGGLNDPEQDIEAYGLAMNVTAELSDAITLRSISAWRKDDTATPIDFDALPAVDLDVPGIYKNEQISEELQLLYERGPLSGLIGFYYLDAQADTLFETRLYTTAPAVLPKLTGYTAALVKTETYAVFGDFTYDITPQLSLSLGGRYTWDQRDADITKQSFIAGGSGVFGPKGLLIATDTNFDGSASFRKFTPRASISFKPNPDHNIYASYSQGFKGGGFDPRGAGANAPDLNGDGIRQDSEVATFLSFQPEQVDSYELGYKGSLMNGRVFVGLAGFYADYTDVQIPGSVACTTAGVPNFCGVVSNAGKAEFYGLEFEGTARVAEDVMTPGDRLTLAASAGYIHADYKEYVTNIVVAGKPTPTDVAAFRHVQNTPEFSGSATLGYMTPVGAGELAFTGTVSYKSKTYQFEIANPYIDQDGYALLDANLVYTAPDDRWSIGLHGRNLLDKQYKTSGYTFVAADPVTGAIVNGANGLPAPSLGPEGVLTAFYGNPRQVFVTGTVHF